MAVNTKQVTGRRELRFANIDEVLADVDRIVEADRAGTLTRLGNWSAGQNFEHVGRLIEMSYDGFDFKAPLPIRVLGRVFRKKFLRGPFPSGIQLKGRFAAVLPETRVSTEDGAAYIRDQLLRIKSGQRMEHDSPVIGPMSHEDWVRLHLNHANHHFSFLIPGDPRGDAAAEVDLAAGAAQ